MGGESRTRAGIVGALAGAALLLTGCAKFDNSAADQTYTPAPKLTPQAGPQPQLPEAGGTGQNQSPGQPGPSIPPPDGCKDFDPAVIGTCLDTVSAVAALPGSADSVSALAAQRRSGVIARVGPQDSKTELAKLDVDAAGDGGLTGITLSPTYTEDQLVFAYLTTGSDNRVVRIVAGQPPKPVLTGIPKGPTGNRGTLAVDGKGALLVGTGDAGNAASAADPNSLAGKVLRIDPAGQPAKDNPNPASAVIASGLHAPGGLCKGANGTRLWVTDRTGDKDLLYRIDPGKPLGAPAWTWPERPGVAGCVDWGDAVLVAGSTAGNAQSVPVGPDGAVTGKPTVMMDGAAGHGYGRLSGMDLVTPELAVAGTVNKDGGKPVSSDDRVVIILRQQVPGQGKD